MKKRIIKFIKAVLAFFTENNELSIVPIAFVLLIFSRPFLRSIDPTAGTFDLGVLQSVIVATFAGAWITGLSWIVFKLSWPHLGKWFDDGLEKKLDQISSTPGYSNHHFNKAVLCFAVYFAYCAIFTTILVALL